MFGEKDKEKKGLIPRIFSSIFSHIEENKEKIKFNCKCSFLEIYNEKISDLFDPENVKTKELREDIEGGVYIENLIEKEFKSETEVLGYIKKGLTFRHVGNTDMNSESSRSHSVFSVSIESLEESETGVKINKKSKLSLIDLAGSERQKSTNTEGDRFTEACSINKSLAVLGKVIMHLGEIQKGKNRYVQYRESKLTFLLKDSLGGNTKTVNKNNSTKGYSSKCLTKCSKLRRNVRDITICTKSQIYKKRAKIK
jgi:kinesin family member 15